MSEKRHTCQKRDPSNRPTMTKKRHTCQKRDIHVRKETYMSEKRPVKQTYHDKKDFTRDLHNRKKTEKIENRPT